MEAEPLLDAKYENGVWYDTMGGEFCQIRDLGDTIGLFRPDCSVEENDPYYTFDENREQNPTKEDSIKEIRAEMRPVPDEAVENTAQYVKQVLDDVILNQVEISGDVERGLLYARGRLKISE